ncbi:MAG: ABC transporter permease, partial [Spirochaetes bacterium]|nr:ABC transporter permease [Spirochaetota bacterium]
MSEKAVKRKRIDKKFDKIRDRVDTGVKKKEFGSRAFRKMLNNRLALAGIIFVTIVILASIMAPLICKYNPLQINLRSTLQKPSMEHFLGTDKLGRDIYSRVIYGGRVSILVGLGSALGAALIGVAIGAYTGYKGGWLDNLMLRLSEIVMAFPQIILVLLFVAIAGQGLMNLIIIFIFTGWGGIYRMTRAQMLSLREEEYVQALQAFGLSTF